MSSVETYDLASLGLRATSYYATLGAVGLALVPAWAHTISDEERSRVALSLRRYALAATGLVLLHRLLDAARLAGEWPGVADVRIERWLWHSTAGVASMTTALGLVVMLAGTRAPRRRTTLPVLLGGALAVGGFALTGHTSQPAVPLLVRALMPLHLVLIAFWLGGIAVLSKTAPSADALTLATRAREFSVVAIRLVPLLAVAGLVIAGAILPGIAALREPYGIGLLGKGATYATLLGLAARNRYCLLPRLETGAPAAGRTFLRTLHLEHALLAGVLAITAGLTTIWGLHAR